MTDRYVGVLYGVASALAFSLAALMYKKGFSKKLDVFLANGLRAAPTFLLLLVVSTAIGTVGELCKAEIMIYAFLSLFFDLILGDTFFFLALRESPLSIAYPVAYSFSLFAVIFSFLFLNEPITVHLLISMAALVLGVYIIYRGSNEESFRLKGLFYSFLTALFWGSSVIFTKMGLYYAIPINLNLARTLMLSILSAPYALYRREQVKSFKGSLKYIVAGGFLGMGLGPVLFYFSVVNVGASRASVLASSAPILSLVLASAILREKIQRKQLIGIVLVILSTYLISIS